MSLLLGHQRHAMGADAMGDGDEDHAATAALFGLDLDDFGHALDLVADA
ncbi:MAG: hypothetical protein WDO24_18910 [Pseudomonadota bacterium]